MSHLVIAVLLLIRFGLWRRQTRRHDVASSHVLDSHSKSLVLQRQPAALRVSPTSICSERCKLASRRKVSGAKANPSALQGAHCQECKFAPNSCQSGRLREMLQLPASPGTENYIPCMPPEGRWHAKSKTSEAANKAITVQMKRRKYEAALPYSAHYLQG